MRKYKIFGFASLVLLIVAFLIFKSREPFWWRFPTKGEIYTTPVTYKNLIIFGNGIGELYAVDKRTGIARWSFRAQHEISTPVVFGDKLLFTSQDGILYFVEVSSGKEIWRFSNPDGFRFYTSALVYKGLVFIGDANGSLFALDAKDANLKWKFRAEKVSNLSDILAGLSLNWFGDFKIVDGVVFLGSRDGNLYALSYWDGKLKWKFESDTAITTNLEILDRLVYFGNKDGESFAADIESGELVWRTKYNDSPVTCVSAFKKSLLSPTYLIQVYENGNVVKGKGSEKVWDIDFKPRAIFCPVSWNSILYFVDDWGKIKAIDEKSGEELWTFQANEGIKTEPLVSPASVFSTAIIYFGDKVGNFFALNPRTGGEVWHFTSFGQINARPLQDKDFVYFVSSDGGLYKLERMTGKISLPIFKKVKFEVNQDKYKAGPDEIVELTVGFDESLLTNPFREVKIESKFIHEEEELTVKGFYYDKDTWKVRFNPPKKGEWKWELSLKLPDRTFQESGVFQSETSSAETRLSVSDKNPRRLTIDGETIFNGVGIQEMLNDFNYNGNPLDDFTIGRSEPLIATGSSWTDYFRSDELTDLQRFLETYGKEGGFNLYRWGIENATFSMWTEFGVENKYFTQQGKWGDQLVKSLRENGYQVWITLFGFHIPIGDGSYPSERRIVEDYVQYMVSRYGSFVGIWEIANEAYVNDKVISFIAEKIHENDYQERPLTISREKPELPEIDIISPHWYESEKLTNSDTRTVEEMSKYKKFDKPVVFGEHGNKEKNWDETSATRLRVRVWSGFFNNAMFVFWNQSDRKDFYNPVLENANIFIGDEERKYLKVFSDFSQGVSLSSETVNLSLDNEGVRSYALQSDEGLLAYFFHFNNPSEETSINFPLGIWKDGTISWIDTASGNVLKEFDVKIGRVELSSPTFTTDIALRVTYNN